KDALESRREEQHRIDHSASSRFARWRIQLQFHSVRELSAQTLRSYLFPELSTPLLRHHEVVRRYRIRVPGHYRAFGVLLLQTSQALRHPELPPLIRDP